MSDDGPEPNNPLSPYYPSETPSLSGNGRRWFALLLAGMLLFGGCYAALSLVISIL